MSKLPGCTVVALLLLVGFLVACRGAPDDPRGGAPRAFVPPPAGTTVRPPTARSLAERPGATSIRRDLLPRPALRPLQRLRPSGTAPPGVSPPASTPAEPPAGTAAPAPVAPAGDGPSATTDAAREAPVKRVEVHAIEAAQGEDGRGNVVPARRPVAIDLHADAWGGRGLDPVLLVGDLEFRHYQYPEPGVLRFVAADAGVLPLGQPVWLRWGDRERYRAAESLEVPR